MKLNILPRVLYLLQTIPKKLPNTFFTSFWRACTAFLRGTSLSRLSYHGLTITKLKGGIGLPDIFQYHQACQLARIIDWNVHFKVKVWVQLEHAMTHSPLHQLPWITSRLTPSSCKTHPLNTTLVTLREACIKYTISSIPGPLTPICQNLDFPPGISASFLLDVWPYPAIHAEHFFQAVFSLCNPLLPR